MVPRLGEENGNCSPRQLLTTETQRTLRYTEENNFLMERRCATQIQSGIRSSPKKLQLPFSVQLCVLCVSVVSSYGNDTNLSDTTTGR